MTAETSPTKLLARFKVPAPDLDRLSFCPAKAAGVNEWVEALPMTRTGYVSTLLYKALPEIARLKVSTGERLKMLETLRPAVDQTLQGLAPQFLNQPLILPEAGRKTATVAQALQKHMSNAYLIALQQLGEAERDDQETLKRYRALALYRSTEGLGRLLLRSYQLYTPVPSHLWLELHSLYQLAELWQLTGARIEREGPATPEQAYLRLLLLACARPNQLRQAEVGQTYEALGRLAARAHVVAYDSAQEDNLFAVLLDSDSAPLYKSRLPREPGGPVREIDTGPVVGELERTREAVGTRPAGTRDEFGLTSALNDHLRRAWRLLAQRSFERAPGRGQMELTVGLSNLHYHLAGGCPFDVFMNRSAPERDLRGPLGKILPTAETQEEDPWGDAFDAGGNRLAGADIPTFNIEHSIRRQQTQQYRGEHPTFEVPIVDTSPGGYCLEWRQSAPVQLKAGELLGLREQGRRQWSVGVVRWVQQARQATLLGVQVLAPRTAPLGAAVIDKSGELSDFHRALEVPAMRALNRPVTLLTNSVTFHEYSKVRLYRQHTGQAEDSDRNESRVQLTRRHFSTGSISQFEYRELQNESRDHDQ